MLIFKFCLPYFGKKTLQTKQNSGYQFQNFQMPHQINVHFQYEFKMRIRILQKYRKNIQTLNFFDFHVKYIKKKNF